MVDVEFVSDTRLAVGDLEFRCAFAPASGGGELLDVLKPPDMVQRYVDLCAALRPRLIVELGIYGGGSTALLAALADPRKLIAVDLDPDPAPKLEQHIERHGLRGSVRPYYGVDQADGVRLMEILESEVGSEALDLVIDDASHFLDETRSSFEVLFPRLRPGGCYVIEDWRAMHRLSAAQLSGAAASSGERAGRHHIPGTIAEHVDAIADGARAVRSGAGATDQAAMPLSRLAMELVLVRAETDGIIDEVRIDEHWIEVRRGDAPLDRDTFRLVDVCEDPLRLLPG